MVRRVANAILKMIKEAFATFPSVLPKQLVMQKVMANPIVKNISSNPNNMAKDAFAQKELLSWFCNPCLK